MKIRYILFIFILSISLVQGISLEVSAQTNTIIVPDDYPTIQEAIAKASDGDTIQVKKGIYHGPINQTLVINKTISIIGENSETTTLNLYPNWAFKGWESPMTPVYGYEPSIELLASDIKLSGFTFQGNGSFYVKGNNTQITKNIIKLHISFVGLNGFFAQNEVTNTIMIGGSGNTVFKNDFTGRKIDVRFGSDHFVNENFASGIGVHSSNNMIFDNIVTNGTGIALVFGSGNSVFGNIITNNNYGLVLYVDGNNNKIFENYVAKNNYALNFRLYYEGGENSTLYHNNFVNNTNQIQIDAPWNQNVYYGTFYFDNGKEGNYWSNYNGTDNNGDGIGETPFIIDSLRQRQDNYPLMKPFEIESINIPEFPSWLLMALFLVTSAVVLVSRNYLRKNS